MTRLEQAIDSLAKAALELDHALTDAYKDYSGWSLNMDHDQRIFDISQKVQNIVRVTPYSEGQFQALKGVIAAWQPPREGQP